MEYFGSNVKVIVTKYRTLPGPFTSLCFVIFKLSKLTKSRYVFPFSSCHFHHKHDIILQILYHSGNSANSVSACAGRCQYDVSLCLKAVTRVICIYMYKVV